MVVARSNLDVAFEILKEEKAPLPFKELFDRLVALQNIVEQDQPRLMSRLYTNLTLDGRFVNLGDNTWDLREHNTYEKVHIDVSDVYSDVEEEDDDLEEVLERKIEEKNALLIDDLNEEEPDEEDEDEK